MCYRYSLDKDGKQLKGRYRSFLNNKDEEEYKPNFHVNGFANPKMPVVTQDNPEGIQLFNWGPFNAFSAENAAKYNTLNAISEEIFDKATYKKNILSKRCLIPASGFFEWMHVQKDKYPFVISISEDIFSFAGIYNQWKDKTGEIKNTFTILTTTANPLMERIHNSKKRMPVILPRELEYDWLKKDLTPEEIKTFFLPYENELTSAYSIDRKVLFSADANTENALTRVEYPELALFLN